ncbi:M10 family metallopeptidase C-terminal domain-containing protein [Shimia sp. CNT1-13L.2]|uniref:M10 family metallopeptidase n=1 Tax=Shimia sp. CNT1-13L.2 TaxID=2959663 RepID=UPI0020CDB071|nr:M10 family metallopeptidase [Shimia sp. CNT1-13L.2]MCP9481908.1 M10 family metallopeptidase C-terminal domain-containing protein [Shimia sp. CNT1-13L.2]
MAHEPDGVIDFGATPSDENITLSGVTAIDALLHGDRWSDFNLTWSTPSVSADYSSGYPDDNAATPDILDTFSTTTAKQNDAIVYWTEQFALVSGLTFTELDGAPGAQDEDQEATIRFANSDDPSTAYGYYPSSNETGGDVWFGSTGDDPDFGDFDFVTVGHELGHALGLKHGHEGTNQLPYSLDSSEFSIMTYTNYVGENAGYNTNGTWDNPQSLMMYDIAAIQYLYGANFGANSGSTTYTFSTTTGEMFINGVGQGASGANRVFRTVWDGNGTDTYDLSNYTTDLHINLAPGGWSDFDVGGNFQRADLAGNEAGVAAGTHMSRGHLFNALQYNNDSRSLIENAIGGSGNDSIRGNDARNNLDGRGGNDTLRGYDGNDTLRGGTGNDLLYGNNQNDQLIGGAGTDTMYGGSGNDSFELDVAGTHSDFFYGGSGNDTVDLNATGTFDLSGANFDDVEEIRFNASDTSLILTNKELDDAQELGDGTIIDGYAVIGADETLTINFSTSYGQNKNFSSWVFQDWGGQNDQIFINGSSSANNITGTTEDDTIDGKGGNDTLNGFSGNDSLLGDAGNDSILGGDGNDTLIGGTGKDTLRGGNNNDRLTSDGDGGLYYGDAGNDTLLSGIGLETMDGGVGIDRIDHTAYNGNYVFDMGTGLTNFIGESYTNFEIAVMGGGNDSVTGNASNNTIYGGNGHDTLLGGSGVDTLYGQGGNDLLSIDSGGIGHVLDGGVGDDTATWSYSNASWIINLTSGSAILVATNYATLVSIENVIGGSGNDSITGDGNNNVLQGGLGNDTLNGGAGVDKLYGEDGNDVLSIGFGGAGHLADGGAGIDTVDFSYGSSNWAISLVSNTAMIGATNYADLVSIENVVGSGGSDSIAGNADANELSGGAGADLLNGGAGNDTLNGNAGNDTLNGEAGDDSLLGGTDNDSLDGGADNDTLSGGDGNDTLLGGLGNDSLLGDANNDSLDGGDGNDTLNGGDGVDTLMGGIGNDNLTGGSGTDHIYGGAGNDTASGGAGNDYFYFTAADVGTIEAVYGGDDTDYMILNGAGVFDFRGLNTTYVETIRFDADGSNVDKTLRLSGKELDGATELKTIMIDGNDNVGSDDTIQIDLTNYVIADLSGWTFVDWNNFNPGDRIIINGDASNETIIGSSQNDEINAGGGINTVDGGDGDDDITFSAVTIGGSFDGGLGIDHLDASGTSWLADITFNLGTGFVTEGGANRDALANIENVTVGGHASVIGDGANNEIIATSPTGNNSLVGGFGDDTLSGGGGDDTLDGGVDDDLLNGGDGNDVLDGSSGTDTIFGGDGNDTLFGGSQSDSLNGGAGDDLFRIIGTEFIDSVDGGTGTDTFDASGYSFGDLMIDMVAGTIENGGIEGVQSFLNIENFIGRTKADTVVGSADDNILDGRSGNDSLLGGGGNDTLLGDNGFDTLKGGGGHDLIQGGENSDLLLGGGGNDTIFGGAHHDTIEGGGGADVIDGGAGDNALSYAADTAGVSVDLGSNTVSGGHATGDVIFGIFNQAIGGSGNDSLAGKWGQANTLIGGAGHDTLIGKNGADNLQGGDGQDSMIGSSGADTLVGGIGADTLDGGSDDDSLIGDAGADSIRGGTGNDYIDGGTFSDQLIGQGGDDTILGGDGNDLIGGGAGADSMDGGAGNDTVSYASDTLDVFVDLNASLVAGGNATGDAISGFEHATTGSGNDILVGSNVGNNLIGGDGNDSVTGNDGDDKLYGNDGNDTLSGGNDQDTLVGGKGADVLDGGAGDDSLVGNGGVDILHGGSQNDTLVGGGGNDTLNGNAGNDQLNGSGGKDALAGGNGSDALSGGGGSDLLNGGNGNDTLTGGSQADVFVFSDGFGQDVITDFNKVDSEDINLAGVTAITDYADLISSHLVNSGGDAMIVDGANSILLQGVAYNDVLNGLNGYTADDFIF